MSDLKGQSTAREVQYWNSAATRPWADQHQRIDRLFANVTDATLALAAPRRGETIVDIGCGSGTTVLNLAAQAGPGGHVLGVDISEHSVRCARERIAAADCPQAEVLLADASAHDYAPNTFDLAFSRFGVMFFADPTASFANLRKAMKPGGRLAFAVFRTAQENPWTTQPMAAVRHLVPPLPPSGPEEPGQFSWADPARVRRILEGAGFRTVTLTPYDPAMQYAGPGGASEAATLAMQVGPVVRATANAPQDLRDRVRAALEAFFQKHDGPQGVVMPGAIWIVRALA
ncbi:methyltransferase domain-containing protein [soil metagenome]